MNENIRVVSVFRKDLRVTSKKTALEFYKGVKSVILIPHKQDYLIRVEPGQLIGLVIKSSVKNGTAQFWPNVYDEDGTVAYRYRKYINAYLGGL